MRIIPKNTKIKMKFYKDIRIPDIILGVIALGFLELAVSSNLPNKWNLVLILLIVVARLFISNDESRLYVLLLYIFKYINAKRSLVKKRKTLVQ